MNFTKSVQIFFICFFVSLIAEANHWRFDITQSAEVNIITIQDNFLTVYYDEPEHDGVSYFLRTAFNEIHNSFPYHGCVPSNPRHQMIEHHPFSDQFHAHLVFRLPITIPMLNLVLNKLGVNGKEKDEAMFSYNEYLLKNPTTKMFIPTQFILSILQKYLYE
ncbi:MAG: hypothetical protein O2897_04360 [bacterium]|nr:hypothetical protein [bacterium]